MIMKRVFEMPNKWTFQMQCVKDLLYKYKAGKNWIDPFAGKYSPAEITNDINPKMNAKYNYEALEFVKLILNGNEFYYLKILIFSYLIINLYYLGKNKMQYSVTVFGFFPLCVLC